MHGAAWEAYTLRGASPRGRFPAHRGGQIPTRRGRFPAHPRRADSDSPAGGAIDVHGAGREAYPIAIPARGSG